MGESELSRGLRVVVVLVRAVVILIYVGFKG
jgi:hypothetical protein